MTRGVPPRMAGFEEYVRARHAEGWTDRQIVAGWRERVGSCCRYTVQKYRRRLGLGSAYTPAQRRAQGLANLRAALASTGAASFGQLYGRWRRQQARDEARRLGWPEFLTATQIRTLEACRSTPRTIEELCTIVGTRRNNMLKVLFRLRRLRLIVRSSGRTRKAAGKGRTWYEYRVPLDVGLRYKRRPGRMGA